VVTSSILRICGPVFKDALRIGDFVNLEDLWPSLRRCLWRPRFLISIISTNDLVNQVKHVDFGQTLVNLGHHLENLGHNH
jgi:hypothetical protein